MISRGVSVTNSNIDEYVNIAHNAEIQKSHIERRTSIGRYTKVRGAEIGAYCAVSWDVTIGADHHPTNRISGSAAFFQKRFGLVEQNLSKGEVPVTKIGNDVLIGCNSVIKAGVKVGNGAIIGSGAVVLSDVEPYEIVGGVPAKHIGWRFDEEVRNRLNESEWWNWSDDKIKQNISLFHEENINNVIEELSKK
ncbi:MAG: CatB-related O-acetyltransferase [Lachnospiraceae bacterium]|nr:CatB-related O-acetyltransferase [Lachnospiraceae bacterium]MBR5067577.1 CatB-related O-acetyltransferase [Lachnospiraceae bacterium]